jgi:hypothetical protein
MNPDTPAEDQRRPALVSIPEAGHTLVGWTRSASYEAARDGRFPVPIVKVGSRSYVRRTDLDAFIQGDASHASPTHIAESA